MTSASRTNTSRNSRRRNTIVDMESKTYLQFLMTQMYGSPQEINQLQAQFFSLLTLLDPTLLTPLQDKSGATQHLNVIPPDLQSATNQERNNSTRDPIITLSRSGTTIYPPDRL